VNAPPFKKRLENANIKLAIVADNVVGISGRAMLEAIITDTANATETARPAKGRLRWK